jgi:hypothetical protein
VTRTPSLPRAEPAAGHRGGPRNSHCQAQGHRPERHGRHGNRRRRAGNDVDATLIDREDAILIARHAIVARGALVWPTGITAAQKATAIAQLTDLGVLVRDSA